MLKRTHIVLCLMALLLFLPHVSNKFAFIVVGLIASLIPDIDSISSTFGKRVKIVGFFIKHRGFIHSFSFCMIVTFVLAVFLPVISLAFFLGYSVHLFADSFTVEGIMPFWPYDRISKGKLRTGGITETAIFACVIVVDVLLFVLLIR